MAGPINKTLNTFEGGLIKNNNPTKQPKNSYTYALNAVINNIVTDNTSISNEKNFRDYFTISVPECVVLGWCWLGNEEYILFIKNKEGLTPFNQIIYINPIRSEKRVLYSNLDLNFQDEFEIKTTYRINYKNQRIVYFVDGLNDDRTINADVDSSTLDISLLSLSADYIKPTIDLITWDEGGNMTSGQYFVAMSYNLGESFTTSPLSISKGISIVSEKYFRGSSIATTIDPSINKQFGDTDGDVIPIPTGKSVSILMSNLDTKYSSYNLYIIKPSSTGTYTIKTIRDISITTNNMVYTGNEGEIDDSITINSIIVDAIKYYASEAITQKDNRLIRGNSKLKRSAINYQALANQIKVTYQIQDEIVYQDQLYTPIEHSNADRDDYLSGDNIYKEHSISPSYLAYTGTNSGYLNRKSFMRDEVYALGISIEFIDGSESAVFHIPGRKINDIKQEGSGEYGRLHSATYDSEVIPGTTNPYWKGRNTALNNGQLAYWRSNLTYTDGFGYPTDGEKDSNGKTYIRHHKMPSDILEPIFRTEVTGDPNAPKGKTTYKVFRRNLSLNISNIQLPDELLDQISNVKIHYVPRTSQNKSILSKGLMYGLDDSNPSIIRQPTHANFGFDDRYGPTKFEFISPDVNFKFKEASILGSRVKVNSLYKGNLQYVGARSYINNTISVAHTHFFNNKAFDDTGRLQACQIAAVPYLLSNVADADKYSFGLKKAVYVDSNFKGSTEGFNLDFSGSEKTAVLELNDPVYLRRLIVSAALDILYPFLYYPTKQTNPTNLQGDQLVSRSVLANRPEYQDRVYFDTVYYVSIVNDNPSLYGKPEDLKYVELSTIFSPQFSELSALGIPGDTYIDMHHFKKKFQATVGQDFTTFDTGSTQIETQFRKVGEVGVATFGSFMVETDINIRMRREGEGEAERYFPKSYYGAHSNRDWMLAAVNEEYYHIDDPYNIQYLKYNFANTVKITDFNNDTDIRYSTRIIYSDKQELEDKGDNFRSVKANNYRDLPLNRGPISLFFTKRDKLYTITRDSLFDVFASNQTIRSENADNIVVGTGEFLSIEPVELVSIDGGYGGSSSKFSLVESPYGHLFVDRKKNKCLLFTDQLKDINTQGLEESFELELYKQFPALESINQFDNPAGLVGVIAIYDPKLQRIIVTKKDYKVLDKTGVSVVNGKLVKAGVPLDLKNSAIAENKSFTVSYSPIRERWISYHSYIPKLYIPHPTDFIKFDTKLQLSSGDGYLDRFVIETIFNEHPDYTKVFDSIQVNLESFNGNIKTNDFFNELLVYNEQQSSGNITLDKTNTTKKEKDWNINKFLDKVPFAANKQLFSTDWTDKKLNYYVDKVVHPLVQNSKKPWYQMGRFRDKYLISRFTYKNLEMKKIIVNFVNSTYRVSTR